MKNDHNKYYFDHHKHFDIPTLAYHEKVLATSILEHISILQTGSEKVISTLKICACTHKYQSNGRNET